MVYIKHTMAVRMKFLFKQQKQQKVYWHWKTYKRINESSYRLNHVSTTSIFSSMLYACKTWVSKNHKGVIQKEILPGSATSNEEERDIKVQLQRICFSKQTQ